MDLAENRFGKTWKHFLEALKVDYNCSLADVCRDQHTTFGGMSSWTVSYTHLDVYKRQLHSCYMASPVFMIVISIYYLQSQ